MITTIAELKTFVGKEIDAAVTFSSVMPFIEIAEDRYLQKYLTTKFWEELTDSEGITVEQKTELRRLYDRALAWFTLFLFVENNTRADEGGMYRSETQQKKSVFKYQENNRIVFEERGFDALDKFLVYLFQLNIYNIGNYAESEEGQFAFAPTVFSARQFSVITNRTINRRTFEQLRSLFLDVQNSMFKQFLPKQYFNLIFADFWALTTIDAKFVKYIQKAAAACALRFAQEQNAVRFDGDRVVSIESYEAGSYERESFSADTQDVHRIFQEMQQNTFLQEARVFALENKNDLDALWSVADGGTNEDADAWVITKTTTEDTDCCQNANCLNMTCNCNKKSKKIFVL